MLISLYCCCLTCFLNLAVSKLYLTSNAKSEQLEPSHKCIQHGLTQLSVRMKSWMIVQSLGKHCVPSCQHAQLKNWPELFGDTAMCFSKCQELSTWLDKRKSLNSWFQVNAKTWLTTQTAGWIFLSKGPSALVFVLVFPTLVTTGRVKPCTFGSGITSFNNGTST